MSRLAEARPCEICGVIFQPPLKALKRGRGKTCSVQCRSVKWSRAASATSAKKKGAATRKARGDIFPHGSQIGTYVHGFYVNNREAPHVLHAHNVVRHALERGELTKRPCEQCGSILKVEAHHDDYEKPLNIRWLCFICHRAFHNVRHHSEGAA